LRKNDQFANTDPYYNKTTAANQTKKLGENVMTTAGVTLKRQDNIAIITLKRPQRQNTMDA